MKITKILIATVAFVLLGSLAVFVLVSKETARKNQVSLASNVAGATLEKFSFTQTISFGGAKPDVSEPVEFTAGESAFDIMSRTHTVQTKKYTFGELIETIEGIANGTDNKYWIFYVNGAQSTIGAVEYKVMPNDTIEWRFEVYEQK